jgi:hypothetical protein
MPRGPPPILWDGARVTQANNGGNFAFQGVVPADCVGRLEDGVPADAVDVALANCAPVSSAPAPVPQTGQTTCWQIGDGPIDCPRTGQDGDIQAGVAWPSPRFTDHLNGTVTDNLTALIWLQDADCFGPFIAWTQALTLANTLVSGTCGLTDGSVVGDWRLPNVKELLSLIDYGQFNPALPAGHPFLNVPIVGMTGGGTGEYWSSSTRLSDAIQFSVSIPFILRLQEGFAIFGGLPPYVARVWPVRGGN